MDSSFETAKGLPDIIITLHQYSRKDKNRSSLLPLLPPGLQAPRLWPFSVAPECFRLGTAAKKNVGMVGARAPLLHRDKSLWVSGVGCLRGSDIVSPRNTSKAPSSECVCCEMPTMDSWSCQASTGRSLRGLLESGVRVAKFSFELQEDFRLCPWFTVTQPRSRVGLVPWRFLLPSVFSNGGGGAEPWLPPLGFCAGSGAGISAFSD